MPEGKSDNSPNFANRAEASFALPGKTPLKSKTEAAQLLADYEATRALVEANHALENKIAGETGEKPQPILIHVVNKDDQSKLLRGKNQKTGSQS